ncbi:MAG: glycerophosphodiester phosphodiesterase family protein [Segniliparus sp.]|uniref:glycerophosphodiester phosphodiesterase family protein n=1 Tax=Segniliparus sp. TaxID=2804064 RepID=UPI003F31AE38
MDDHSVIGGQANGARAAARDRRRARFLPLLASGFLLAACQSPLPEVHIGKHVEVIAHEGGRGLYLGDSVAAFQNALELGVDVLDLDVVPGKEQGPEGRPGHQRPVPLVWGDLTADSSKCDGQFTGQPLKELTFAQVDTLVCDKAASRFPGQKTESGNKIAVLSQVFNLIDRRSKFTFDIEIRTVPNDASSSTPEQAAGSVLAESVKDHREGQVRIKSFDWRNLDFVRKQNPKIRLIALYDEKTFFPGSPWLGSVDYAAVGGDPVKAAQQIGAEALSPCYTTAGCAGSTPPGPGAPLLDKGLVDRAHKAGIKVVPWTVNDEKAMAGLIDLGVDGIVTDYPDRLREVLKSKGLEAPDPYKPPVAKTLQKNPPGLDN